MSDRDVGKKPLVKWEEFQRRLPTEAEARRWWGRFAEANIGLATGAVSGVFVVDADGPEAVDWIVERFGGLPDTLTSGTHRGKHFYFAHPGFEVRNAVEIAPKVDVRGTGGYVVLPPSTHASGFVYDWADPEAPVAEAPDWLLGMLGRRDAARPGMSADEIDRLLEGVPDGQRNDALMRLAGHWFGKGLPLNEVERLALAWNRANRPPAPDEDIVSRVRRLFEAHQWKRTGGGALSFPAEAYVGVAADFAHLYARNTESPTPFLFVAFNAYLGSIVAPLVTIASELLPEPRLYAVILGSSADGRKSSSLDHADRFFRTVTDDDLPIHYGLGSAEGLAARLGKDESGDVRPLLLHLDELRILVDKARQDGSLLLPLLASLFERTTFDNTTKTRSLTIRDAHLSLVAAATTETYTAMWSSAFLDIGLLNRLWLCVAEPERRVALPAPIPESERSALATRVREILAQVERRAREAGGRLTLRLGGEALGEWETWYRAMPRDIYARRLDTYGWRWIILLSLGRGDFEEVSADTVRRVCRLLDHQHELRRVYDPIDAETLMAKVEGLIRRGLARGPKTRRELAKAVHAERYGSWTFKQSLDNLTAARDIRYDKAVKRYALAE